MDDIGYTAFIQHISTKRLFVPNVPLEAVCIVTSTVAKYDTGMSQFISGHDVIKLFSCFHAQLSRA